MSVARITTVTFLRTLNALLIYIQTLNATGEAQ